MIYTQNYGCLSGRTHDRDSHLLSTLGSPNLCKLPPANMGLGALGQGHMQGSLKFETRGLGPGADFEVQGGRRLFWAKLIQYLQV